ncbi:MAG: divergent PAP2 family protein [Clostridia bacterium]|nr:divergent PAP2 family protein [Clostridia bacterium]
MNWLLELVSNPFLITAVSSWALAQVIKCVIEGVLNKKLDLMRLFGDGGMPSAHSATVCSLALLAALRLGCGSFEFALAAVFAVVVCRDAVGVRQETGKQAILLQEISELLERITKEDLPEVRLKMLVGHTPLQVFAGMCLGAFNAVVMNLILV